MHFVVLRDFFKLENISITDFIRQYVELISLLSSVLIFLLNSFCSHRYLAVL